LGKQNKMFLKLNLINPIQTVVIWDYRNVRHVVELLTADWLRTNPVAPRYTTLRCMLNDVGASQPSNPCLALMICLGKIESSDNAADSID